MTLPVYGEHEKVSRFVAELLNFPRDFGNCVAIGFENQGLVAGVVFHNWNPEAATIELSAASIHRRWLSKANLRRIFSYPFDQIGVQLCVARTSEKNKRVRRIWKALGAKETIIERLRGEHEGEAILTLTKEAWDQNKLSKDLTNG